MDDSVCKQGKAYNSQAQEIINNLSDFMSREAANNAPVIPLKYVQKRVTAATGVSRSTYYNIKKRIRNGILSTPGKHRKHKAPKTKLDSFEAAALRREIMNMYGRKEIPTAKRLRNFLRDNFDYYGSVKSVQRMLRDMGFRWKRQNNRKLLLEREDIVAQRRKYLRAIKKNASAQQPYDVLFLDETYLHKTETVTKTWQLKNPDANESTACCIKIPIGKGPRLIIVHCGGEKGWVEGAHRFWRNTNPVSADYHGDMNTENFKNWFQNLCQLLEEPTLIVMDNASYHSTVTDKIPNTSSRKEDIKDWLDGERISYPEHALKAELLTIVRSIPKEKVYLLDQIAHAHGHRILRLPPYHCDLNPIELVWAQCKAYVRENNREFTLDSVQKLWCESVESVTEERWAACVRHVKTIEEEYWVKDGIVEEEIEKLIITFGDLSSDSEEQSESESETEVSKEASSDEDLGVFPLEQE